MYEVGMPRRRQGNKLEHWEIAIVKAMVNTGRYNDQDILAYFTRPTRSINHARIAEIRTGDKHYNARAASAEELEGFLSNWPNIDSHTGLSVVGDELLIKARDAAICAIQNYNSASRYFKSETSIVLMNIAWTYLFHSILKRDGVDFRYKSADGNVLRTPSRQEKYWDLSKCLRWPQSPLHETERKNVEFLMGIRHKIEHRKTDNVDRYIAPYLQSSVLNFNKYLVKEFGRHLSLSKDISTALQLNGFDAYQRESLRSEKNIPREISAYLDDNILSLSDEEAKDPRFSYRVALVPKVSIRANRADELIEFIRPDSEEGQEIQKILIKEGDRARFTATEVLRLMHEAGYTRFTMPEHTKLWQRLGAKDPQKQYGRAGDYRGTWVWYQKWVDTVMEHCVGSGDKYR